jgi:urease accessory protein
MPDHGINSFAMQRLLQLSSPALPVGAYAYSQGLESAVENNWVGNREELVDWLNTIVTGQMAYLDVPVLQRLHSAWVAGSIDDLNDWNNFLLASRESKEILDEDKQLASALTRLIKNLELNQWEVLANMKQKSYATVFSFAARCWGIETKSMTIAYVYAWLENQVAAAIKLVPLGQTEGQQTILELSDAVEDAVEQGLKVNDEDIGFQLPGLAMASCWHERQYSRLFRS